jgi:Membrane carboxypeptidase/penicillin-binding protein PbpC
VDALAHRWGLEFGKSNISNMAIIVVDIHTNNVVAYCGNINYNSKFSGNKVDIITSKRSTGSILKPFLYYAAINQGDILKNTLLADIPINISGYAPSNFSNNYNGAVPASEALSRSLNIPFVLLLQEYDITKFYNFLKGIGISTLDYHPSHYGLSIILGGAEATLWDLTQAYTSMGRSLLKLPQNYLKLSNERKDKEIPTQFNSGAVWITFEALKEVNRPEEIDWKTIPSMYPVAWKTGTSYGFRDAWSIGVNPNYAVGVWVGNASGEGKPELIGARTAAPVMFDVFNLLPSANKWFTMPSEEFTEVEVCKLSGMIKGRFCDVVDTLLILPQGVNSKSCNFHHSVTLSADEKYRVYATDNGNYITKSWFTLPPVWEWYYKQHHPEYKTLPPFKNNYYGEATASMQFIYPTMNAIIKIPKQMDGSLGSITAELAHENNNTTIFWHLDENYLTSTKFIHKISLQPAPGKHSLTAIDSEGNTISITFFIKSDL